MNSMLEVICGDPLYRLAPFFGESERDVGKDSMQKMKKMCLKSFNSIREREILSSRHYFCTKPGLSSYPKRFVTLSDQGILHLRFFPAVTDAAVEVILAQMPKLRSLHLCFCTKITERALERASNLERLASLNLDGSRITSEGLKEITNLQGLAVLLFPLIPHL